MSLSHHRHLFYRKIIDTNVKIVEKEVFFNRRNIFETEKNVIHCSEIGK